jgi:hypothetical protein
MAIRFKRCTPETWRTENFKEMWFNKNYPVKEGRLMYPSTHDITPEFLSEHISFLEKILNSGNSVLIVTKPHLECIREICSKLAPFRDNILFRFTIGSANSDVLAIWEPGAPSFEERLESLQYAFDLGFETSVSCEPMLDDKPTTLTWHVLPYVTDAVWLGKANFLIRRMRMNGITDPNHYRRAEELVKWQNDNLNIESLYNTFCNNPRVKWKESLKKVLKIDVAEEIGMDI